MTTDTLKIPEGYKQTEVGIIPVDWVVKKCADLGSYYKGRGISSRDLVPDGLPCIMYGDIYVKFDTKFSKADFRITKQIAAKSSMAKPGDLFFTTSGETAEEIGKCVAYEGKENIYIGGDIIGLTPNSGTDSLFLAYMQNSKMLLSQKENLGQGYTVVHIYTEHIKSLKIPLPPTKSEQTAIATALSDLDALIEKLESLLEKKKNVKQGAMQELLTSKRRLPGFSGEWETKTLGEVAEFDSGHDLPKADLVEGGSKKCIHYGQLFSEYKELISEIKSRTNKDVGCFYSKANDVLLPTSDVTPRGLATASCIKEDGVILGGGILVIRLDAKYDGLYFSYFVSQNKSSVLKFVKGSTVFHLYASDLTNFEVTFPELKEQIAIATVLSEMDTEIKQLESKLTKYQNLKQGMMQTLLTGKIRLI